MHCPISRRRALLLAGVAVCAAAPLVQAADGDTRYTFSGFGTLGVVHSDYDRADFAVSLLKDDGAGATRRISLDVDSRLGAQLCAARGKWSGVLQVVSDQGPTGSYEPVLEWANVQYQATPDLALRVGRIALPMFLAADYRKVGYAYPWARTPVEMYAAVPITRSDGADLNYRWRLGAANHVTQLVYGRTRARYDARSVAVARHLGGLAHTVAHGPLTARVSALETEITLDTAHGLFDAFREFGQQGEAIAQQYDVDHKRARVVSFGASYDPGRWFVTAEVARVRARSYIGDKAASYLSAGYRSGDATAYAILSHARPRMATRVQGLSTEGMTQEQAAAAAALNAILNDILRYVANQDSLGVGLRWDAHQDVAVKLQYERLRRRGDSYGALIRIQPGYRADREIGVASLVVDFVF